MHIQLPTFTHVWKSVADCSITFARMHSIDFFDSAVLINYATRVNTNQQEQQ